MFSLKEPDRVFPSTRFTKRGLAIALCMGLFSPRYWWPGNLSERMFRVHSVNYVPDGVPILKAAHHCVKAWRAFDWGSSEPPTPDEAVYTNGIL
jgi:hypothetical protein